MYYVPYLGRLPIPDTSNVAIIVTETRLVLLDL